MNQTIDKYPVKALWLIYWGNSGGGFYDLDKAIAELSGFINGEGKTQQKVKEECLRDGHSSGGLWSIEICA